MNKCDMAKSTDEIKMGGEELNMFKEAMGDLIKTSLSVLNSLERHNLIDVGTNDAKRAERRKQIETIIKRTNLYKNYFGQTTMRDMDEHYMPMYKVYMEYRDAINAMAKQLCNPESPVDTNWLSKNKITIVIDQHAGVILHVQVIFQLSMELRRTVESNIDGKYKDMIANAHSEDVEDLKDQMYEEKYGAPETSYVDRYLLSIISVILAICQESEVRKVLKMAASNIMHSLPQSKSGGGGFLGGLGGLGDIIGSVMKNLQGGEGGGPPDGANIGEAITGALSSAFHDGQLGDVLTKASQSSDAGELTKHLSDAFNNPALSNLVNGQVARANMAGSVAPPPRAGDMPSNTADSASTMASSSYMATNSVVEMGDDVELI